MKLRVIVTLVTALALGVGTASAQSIGIFFDTGGATCSTSQAPFTPGTLYVLAVLGGSVTGVTGAEFRVDGFPVGWFGSYSPNPLATASLGSVGGLGGNIAFGLCQTGLGGIVLLYTNSYFATSAVSSAYLSILRHTTPSNPNFPCPLVTLCDAPVFSARCVNGGQAIINGGSPCTVAAVPATWSSVKELYTN